MTLGNDIRPAIEATLSRRQALAEVTAYLAAQGVEDAWIDARSLLFAAAGLTRTDLVLEPEALLGHETARRLAVFAMRRGAREPVSRIVGERGFWTLDLIVRPGVLDPRPDTETLVAFTLELLRERRREAVSVLDLGSGSGAIICALLAELPQARGIAVDLSAEACAATRANLRRCGLGERANVLRGRWAAALRARFDVIVSNPPYIPTEDISGLDAEVSRHDPAVALDGGADGMSCYREIAAQLPDLLAPGGIAVLEAGAGQAKSIERLLMAQGLECLGTRRDAGGHERAVAAGA